MAGCGEGAIGGGQTSRKYRNHAGGGDKSGGESATNDESVVIVGRYYTVSSITSNISMRRPLLPPEVTAMIVNH